MVPRHARALLRPASGGPCSCCCSCASACPGPARLAGHDLRLPVFAHLNRCNVHVLWNSWYERPGDKPPCRCAAMRFYTGTVLIAGRVNAIPALHLPVFFWRG